MKILVTNDDGYTAPGLTALARRLLSAGHEVVVAAPFGQQSGSSSSLGRVEPGALVTWKDVSSDDLPGVRVIAIDGPPALAVKIMHSGVFGWSPDLVVSGINFGWNSGGTILHSGTLGAAMTACTLGINSIAMSCARAPEGNLHTAAEVAASTVELLRTWRGATMALNVNVPSCSIDAIKGVRHVSVARHGLVDVGVELKGDELRLKLINRIEMDPQGYDSEAALNGFVAVTVFNGRFFEVEPLGLDVGEALTACMSKTGSARTTADNI